MILIYAAFVIIVVGLFIIYGLMPHQCLRCGSFHTVELKRFKTTHYIHIEVGCKKCQCVFPVIIEK